LKQKCPEFTPDPKSRFNTHSLIQLIGTYSRCKNPIDQLQYYYEPKPDRIRFYVEPTLGLNLNTAKFSEFTYYGRGQYTGNPPAAIAPGLAI
jgi:hypothetical protein